MTKHIKHKKAFELSINFIVMVILSLAMLGVGFYFAKNIFIQTYDIGQQLDDQTKSQIESKLRDPASLVAIGINQKTIKRGDHDIFGVGVANRNKEEGYFYLEASCNFGSGKDTDGNEVEIPATCTTDQTCCSKWIQGKSIGDNVYMINIGKLKPNEFEVGTIFFNIDKKATAGLYVYNIQAYKTNAENSMAGKEKYDSVKKIYVKVP